MHQRDGKTYTATQTLLKHQLDGLGSTFRFPGECIDTLETRVPPVDLYAVVWSGGVGYKVELANVDGVFSADSIAAQIVQLKSSKIVRSTSQLS